jgi:outer membrane protein OmpA-like peptidoglycan-associated protein
MRRLCGGVLATVLVTQVGCAVQRPAWNKPWGRGALVGAMICCPAGAGVGALIQSERRGTSTATVINDDGSLTTIRKEDDKELWKGAVIGCAVGIPLCGILGHVFFDEMPEAPVAPPSPTGEELPPGGIAALVKRRIVLRGVYFDFDRIDIRPDSKPVLDEAAAILTDRRAEIEAVVVEGHTDAIGTDEYNQTLSIKRAEAVYQYLVNKGVPPELMRTEGYGESRPVADNETDSGRAQNRRVELRVAPAGGPAAAPPAEAPAPGAEPAPGEAPPPAAEPPPAP